MRIPLVNGKTISQDGSVSSRYLGREVLVLKIEGKLPAFLNLCGGPADRGGSDVTSRLHWDG